MQILRTILIVAFMYFSIIATVNAKILLNNDFEPHWCSEEVRERVPWIDWLCWALPVKSSDETNGCVAIPFISIFRDPSIITQFIIDRISVDEIVINGENGDRVVCTRHRQEESE